MYLIQKLKKCDLHQPLTRLAIHDLEGINFKQLIEKGKKKEILKHIENLRSKVYFNAIH